MYDDRLFSFIYRSCETFGRQSWVMVAMIITEFLVIAKFDFKTITKPLPIHITYFWILGFCALFFWTVWKFLFVPKFYFHENIKSAKSSEQIIPDKYAISDEGTAGKDDTNGNLHHRSCPKQVE